MNSCSLLNAIGLKSKEKEENLSDCQNSMTKEPETSEGTLKKTLFTLIEILFFRMLLNIVMAVINHVLINPSHLLQH